MFLYRIMCLFDRHRPIRSKVRSEGGYLIGNCRRCGTRIRRTGKRNWARDRGPKAGDLP